MRKVKGICTVVLIIITILMFFPPICKLISDFWEPVIRELLGQ